MSMRRAIFLRHLTSKGGKSLIQRMNDHPQATGWEAGSCIKGYVNLSSFRMTGWELGQLLGEEFPGEEITFMVYGGGGSTAVFRISEEGSVSYLEGEERENIVSEMVMLTPVNGWAQWGTEIFKGKGEK